jgi:ankyrin repeat protein
MENMTPLHLAVHVAPVNPNLVRLFLEAGADVNAQTEDGRTVVTMATSADAVACLIDAGADIPTDFNSPDPQIQHLINEERERYERVRMFREIGLPSFEHADVHVPSDTVLAHLIERVTPLHHSGAMTSGLFEVRLLNHVLEIPELWRIAREQHVETALILSELKQRHWDRLVLVKLLNHLRQSRLRNPMNMFQVTLLADEIEDDLQRMQRPMEVG